MEEIWKDIPNYEGYYQVSSLGRVKSLGRSITRSNGRLQTFKERILKPQESSTGYLIVGLSVCGKFKTIAIHKLVAISFLGHIPCGYKFVINHKNFQKHDNRVENLEIVTNRENSNQKHIPSSSKYTGVYFFNGKWRAVISNNGENIHLGIHKSELLASKAYIDALNQLTTNGKIDNRKYLAKYSSKHKGVSWRKDIGKWVAYANINGKQIYFGCFKEEIDAINKVKSIVDKNI